MEYQGYSNLIKMSQISIANKTPSASWRTHGSHKLAINQCAKVIVSSIPSSKVHILSK